MARKKAQALEHVRNLTRYGVTPASQGLDDEGMPLPDVPVIDPSANDADEDADGGRRGKNRGEGASRW